MMSPVRELRVVLDHPQDLSPVSSSLSPNEVKLHRHRARRSTPSDPKQSKELRNLVINMKTEPGPSKAPEFKRLTRASLKTPPDPPTNQKTRSGKRGRPLKSSIKRESIMEIKQEPNPDNPNGINNANPNGINNVNPNGINNANDNQRNDMNDNQNNDLNDQPLQKRRRFRSPAIVDLTAPSTLEIKREDLLNPNLLELSDLQTDTSVEFLQLNNAFLERTDSSANETLEASINNENDQNMSNKRIDMSLNETEEISLIDDNSFFDSADVENMIKVHVITIDEGEETSKASLKSRNEHVDHAEGSGNPVASLKSSGNTDNIDDADGSANAASLKSSDNNERFDDIDGSGKLASFKSSDNTEHIDIDNTEHIDDIDDADNPAPSKSGDLQQSKATSGEIQKSSKPEANKMKCLNDIISEVFDIKLPESEERMYFTMQHLIDEYKQDKIKRDFRREMERKKYERAVQGNIQGIKLLLNRMTKKKIMMDQTTQTESSEVPNPFAKPEVDQKLNPPEVDQNLNPPAVDQKLNPPEVDQKLTPSPEVELNPSKVEDSKLEGLGVVPEESPASSDLPAGDLTGMIVLDSVDASHDHQSSVFQRLGDKSPVNKDNHQYLMESPENPSPGPLKFIELQRELVERHNRDSNIVITGFRCPKNRVEADVSEYLWKQMGVNAGVVRIMKIGHALVVTVASHIIKKQVLKRRGITQRSNVRIYSDYTGRERKVQKWLEAEERRRKKLGQNARAAYGKIMVDGIWWFWDEFQGRLCRKRFRPDLVHMQ